MTFSIVARSVCFTAAAGLLSVSPSAAQQTATSSGQTGTVTGLLRQAGSLKPVSKATIVVEGTALEATSDAEGRFTLAGIPPGSQHLVIAAPGFLPQRVEIQTSNAAPLAIDVLLAAEVHYTEVDLGKSERA